MLAQNEAQAQAQTQSDRPIIFTHTTVATPDLTQDDVALAVVGGTIAAIGPNDAVMRQYPNADIYDGRGKAILPGLVNGPMPICAIRWRGDLTRISASPIPPSWRCVPKACCRATKNT